MIQYLSSYLRSSRENANLSQRNVAYVLGYSTPQFVSNWERGISRPPFEQFIKIAKLYKVDIRELEEVCAEEIIRDTTNALKDIFYGKGRPRRKVSIRAQGRLQKEKKPLKGRPPARLSFRIRNLHQLHLKFKNDQPETESALSQAIGEAFISGSPEKICTLIVGKYGNLDTLLALNATDASLVYRALSKPSPVAYHTMQRALQILQKNYR